MAYVVMVLMAMAYTVMAELAMASPSALDDIPAFVAAVVLDYIVMACIVMA